MPTYEYKCIDCGWTVECQHSIENRDVPHYCQEECISTWGIPNMKRVISKAAVSFKGSGFYSTDSRKKK